MYIFTCFRYFILLYPFERFFHFLIKIADQIEEEIVDSSTYRLVSRYVFLLFSALLILCLIPLLIGNAQQAIFIVSFIPFTLIFISFSLLVKFIFKHIQNAITQNKNKQTKSEQKTSSKIHQTFSYLNRVRKVYFCPIIDYADSKNKKEEQNE